MTPRRPFPDDEGPGSADDARADHAKAGHSKAADDARIIDERYGLEPAFEPGDGREVEGDPSAAGTEPCTVECPYCGEPFETLLDLSAGPANYIEDCQVCCQPIEFEVQTDAEGRLSTVSVRRGD